MKKELTPSNVDYIIVSSSNTTQHEDLTLTDILNLRKKEGFTDIGYHYVITRDGYAHSGIHTSQAGTHTSRFNSNSIGILIIGGNTTRSEPFDNYRKRQKIALLSLLDILTLQFPKAKPIGSGALLGGTNPHFDIGEFYDTRTDGTPSSQA